MNQFKEIKPEQLSRNAFELIGKDWMLVTAKKGDQVNTMTAFLGRSWCNVGKRCCLRGHTSTTIYKRIY